MRKKRSAPAPRRGRWLLLPVLAGSAVIVLVAGGLLARDVVVVRDALLDSQAELRAVQASLGSADVVEAEEQLRAADQQLATARSRSRGPLWNLAAALPVIQQPVEVVRGVVDVASAATDVARVAVQDGGELLTTGLDVRVEAGRIDLAPLQDAAALLDGLPTEALREATEDLRATDPGWSPAEVVDGRDRTLELADQVLDLIDRGDALLTALPGYLGADEPRTYFLGIQTSAELRSTGGLIGFYSTLTIDDGAFTIGNVDVYEALDDFGEDGQPAAVGIGSLSGPRDQRASAPADFLARYDQTGADTLFSNVNVDPDLPLTSQIALELYELRTGQALDGVILLDPIGLQAVLEATGTDVPMPADLIEGTDLPEVLPASSFAKFVTTDIYTDFGSGRSGPRKELLGAVGAQAFAGVFSGAWDGVQVARTVADITSERHLQVYSTDPVEQEAFTRVRATGALADVPAIGDRLAVTANNAVGGKQDVHLGHRTDVSVDLEGVNRTGADGPVIRRATTVRTEVVNPLPSSGMDEYIIGNCLISEVRNQCFEGPPGWNRTWWSVWTQGDGDRLRAGTGPDGPLAIRAGDLHGLRVFDRVVETPPGGSEWFQVRIEGRVAVEADGDDLLYTWTWWRQAKAVPDVLDVRITPPPGYRIVDHELVGVGDSARLMGVDADAAPATLTVEPDLAHLEGAVSRDTSLTLRLSRTPS